MIIQSKLRYVILFVCLMVITCEPFQAAAAAVNKEDKEQTQLGSSIYLMIGSCHSLVRGEMKQMQGMPVLQEGTTLVPLRFVSEQLQAKVSWDEITKKIELLLGDQTVDLELDQAYLTTNGRRSELPVAVRRIGDHTYVPLRAISEVFGKTISYADGLIAIQDHQQSEGESKGLNDRLKRQLSSQNIKINISSDPPLLDSSLATTNLSQSIINLFHEGLYRLNEKGILTPALAQSLPQISEDKLTYTIKLRNNLTWSDGAALTANDFVYSIERTLDPANHAPYSFLVGWIKKIIALDENTLQIQLDRSRPQFTNLLASTLFFPQRKDKVESYANQYGTEWSKVIGAGPFLLTSWDHNHHLTLQKNDLYWDAENVQLDDIQINVVRDGNYGMYTYSNGEVDFTESSVYYAKQYSGQPDLITKNELTTSYLMFQSVQFPAFSNLKIRKALSLAIDREYMLKAAVANGSVAATGFVPIGVNGGNGKDYRSKTDSLLENNKPDQAKMLLSEGLKELGLTSLPSFNLLSDDTEGGILINRFITQSWKNVLGIDVISSPIPHSERVRKENSRDFEASMSLWGADYNDPMTFLDMFTSDAQFNQVGYSNKQYDALIAQAGSEYDNEKRVNLLVQAEKQLLTDLPIAPLYFRNRVYLKNPEIAGMFSPSFGLEWELKWASLIRTDADN